MSGNNNRPAQAEPAAAPKRRRKPGRMRPSRVRPKDAARRADRRATRRAARAAHAAVKARWAGLDGVAPRHRFKAAMARCVANEAQLFRLGRKLGLELVPFGASPAAPAAAPAPTPVITLGSLVPPWVKATLTLIAFVVVAFVAIATAGATPVSGTSPTAPAAPSQPAQQPTNTQPLTLPAKKDEEMTESLELEAPSFSLTGPAAPRMSVSHSVSTHRFDLPMVSPVTHVEAQWVSSIGKTGLEILQEQVGADPKAKEWLTALLRAAYRKVDAPEDLTIYPSNLDLLGKVRAITTPNEEHDMITWAEAAIRLGWGVYRGANSSLAFQAWEERGPDSNKVWVPTAIAALLHATGDTVDCTQYGVSLWGASTQGPGFVNGNAVPTADLHTAGIKVVMWDFRKPIGTHTTPGGKTLDVRLCAAGSDGELICTLANPSANTPGVLKDFQTRGYVLGNKVTVLKGAVEGYSGLFWARDHLWTGACDGAKDIPVGERRSVLVVDSEHSIKGGGKTEWKHGDVVGAGTVVSAWSIVDWADGESRPLERTRASFQLTEFFCKEALGEELWDKMALSGEKISKVIEGAKKAPENAQEIVDLLYAAGVQLEESHLATLYARTQEKFVDLMASGVLWKTQLLKVVANDLVPVGCVVMGEANMVEQQGDLLPRAAVNRMPAISPLSVTAPIVITTERLAQFALSGEKLGDLVPGTEQCWGDWLQALCNRQNHVAAVNKWHTEVGITVHAMSWRLYRLCLETYGAVTGGVMRVNPLDSSLRNEDQDGDSSTCDTTVTTAQAYAKVETHWDRCAVRFEIEMPKKNKRSWTDASVLGVFGELGLPSHPKGGYTLELFLAPNDLRMKEHSLALEIAKVVATPPQGPTGMWSNVAADLFLRLRWERQQDGKFTYARDQRKLFKAWVYACVMVQFSIDWQKRTYPLVSIDHYEEVADAFLSEDPPTAYLTLVEKYGAVGLESVSNMLPATLELADNYCTMPTVPYKFATVVANLGLKKATAPRTAAWKATKGAWNLKEATRFAYSVPTADNSYNLYSHALRLAFCDGYTKAVADEVESQRRLREQVAGVLWARYSGANLNAVTGTMNAAMREIAASNNKLGDAQFLRKLRSQQVFSSWVNFLDLRGEDRDTLLDGGDVHGLTKWHFLAAAMGHQTPHGSLPLWQVIVDAFLAKAKKDAMAATYLAISTRVGNWLRADPEGNRVGYLRGEAAKLVESINLRDPKVWVTTTSTQQVEVWAALDSAITENLEKLMSAVTETISTGKVSGSEETYLENLRRPFLKLLEENAKAYQLSKGALVGAANAHLDKARDGKVKFVKWRWLPEEQAFLPVYGKTMVTPSQVWDAVDVADAACYADYTKRSKKIAKEWEALVETLYSPIKRLWVTARTMASTNLKGKVEIMGHTVERSLLLCGVNPASCERRGRVMPSEVHYPTQYVSAGTAGYEEKYTTCPIIAMERFAATPFAIGPTIPVKQAMAFATPLLNGGGLVKSYSAFPSRNIVSLRGWEKVYAAAGAAKLSAWDANRLFRLFGRRISDTEVGEGVAAGYSTDPHLAQDWRAGLIIDALAKQNGKVGFVPPAGKGMASELIACALVALAIEQIAGSDGLLEDILYQERPNPWRGVEVEMKPLIEEISTEARDQLYGALFSLGRESDLDPIWNAVADKVKAFVQAAFPMPEGYKDGVPCAPSQVAWDAYLAALPQTMAIPAEVISAFGWK